MHLYTDSDPYLIQWTQNLVNAGLLPIGDAVLADVQTFDDPFLSEYDQVHWFNGIGGWPYALQLAGWPNDRPCWTGSCPCQPFSVAGHRKGDSDERHLWPYWKNLIAEHKPPTIFGEQVASPDGRDWLAAVRSDLEAMEYAVGCADLCAAGVGAPHIRQRLWFVADALGERLEGWSRQRGNTPEEHKAAERGSDACGMADTPPWWGRRESVAQRSERGSEDSRVGESNRSRCNTRSRSTPLTRYRCSDDTTSWNDYPWRDCDWLPCADGKHRPVESGTFPLVDGAVFRMGSGSPYEGRSRAKMIRAYGNAIVPQVAAIFVRAFMDTIE